MIARRRRTIAELADRTRQALLARLEQVLPGEGLDPVSRPVRDAAAAVATRLTTADLLPFPRRPPGLPAGTPSAVVARADAIAAGRFSILGQQAVEVPHPVNWLRDPLSGQVAPLAHWKRIEALDQGFVGDRKPIWELNRHQHLQVLGRAFALTGDDRYARVLVDHVTSWLAQNPPPLGINWASSLELAFRAIAWLFALHFFRPSPRLTADFVTMVVVSLWRHGRHIERYLSRYSSPNTHLTGEALGLYYLGTCLSGVPEADRWRSLGRGILLDQVERHIRRDGVYFEQATWYQRYTADFYTHFLLLACASQDRLPPRVEERLERLIDHLMWITRPDGTTPCLGDDDGGRLACLDERACNDWRSVLSNGALLFGRSDFKHVAGGDAEESAWLFGDHATRAAAILDTGPPAALSKPFHDGGCYVMRDGWSADASTLVVDCGPLGVMNCGHSHADTLAIEVVARGRPLLIDPGTYVYGGAPDLRDHFRSTAMHNTVTVDGQSSSVPDGPFKWRHAASADLRCWHDHPDYSYFHGCHDGYRRLTDPVTHSRSILFLRGDYWVMLDRMDACERHVYRLHFHLSPGASATLDAPAGRLEAVDGTSALDVSVVGPTMGSWSLSRDWVSPCYASRTPADVAEYAATAPGPAAFLSVLFPRAAQQAPAAVSVLTPSAGQALCVRTTRYNDVILHGPAGLDSEGLAADFEWVSFRRDTGGAPRRAILLHGAHATFSDMTIRTSHPVRSAVVTWQDALLRVDLDPVADLTLTLARPVTRAIVNGRDASRSPIQDLALGADEIAPWDQRPIEGSVCHHVRN